jgi:hypothetical protein
MQEAFNKLKNTTVQVTNNDTYPEEGMASVLMKFSDGTTLRTDYWRLIKNNRQLLSSFDHQQQYGLPEPIDAKAELQNELRDLSVSEARLDQETGDLSFQFGDHCNLQVLNFTGYEIWEITFPDGSREFSNYNR